MKRHFSRVRKVPLVFPISNIEICFIIIHINRINQLGFKVFELNERKIKYTIKGWREREKDMLRFDHLVHAVHGTPEEAAKQMQELDFIPH